MHISEQGTNVNYLVKFNSFFSLSSVLIEKQHFLFFQDVDCHFNTRSSLIILKGDASEIGRFGSTLAVLPDLNLDGFKDLAVGAPLENNGEGSIYIFLSESGKSINPSYSQVEDIRKYEFKKHPQ